MQTALDTMEEGQQNNHITRPLLDTGSSRTLQNELMELLKLKPIEEHTFSIYVFGNTKLKQSTLTIIDLIIETKFGGDIKIKATVTK